MVEEIRKSGLTFKEAKNLVDISIRDVKDGFVATGYYLWIIREERLWEDDGYNSFQEFLHCQYQKDKSWASRCIGLYEKFGKQISFGELPVLAAPYRDYSLSQLIEMVPMTEEQREQVTPDMKVREIRELKPKRDKKTESQREALPDEEDQLPGQISLEDYPDPVATVATGEGQEETQEAQEPPEGVKPEITPGPEKGQETAQEGLQGAKESEGCAAAGACASMEEAVAEKKPLSAHGTPRKVYPEGSLIASVGCGSNPDGPKGGYNCFSCARECGIRQKERYCVEAPMGNPFPCDRMDGIGTLREAMGDQCQFVNLDLAYRRQGDGEPVPCCKDCSDPCDFRCSRAESIVPVSGYEPEPDSSGSGGLNETSRPEKFKTYDRDILEKMISDAENEMELMRNYWMQDGPRYYTQKAMEIQAYKNLLVEHDAEEAARSGLVENPDLKQPELPAGVYENLTLNEAIEMKQIRKKILPQYFKEVCAENKRFELRKDEDNVQVGDEIILEEWEPDKGYTGEIALRPVTYVLRNASEYGLMDGYCIIGF